MTACRLLRLVLYLFFAAGTFPVAAQSTGPTITGRVVDDSTGVPLARAHVFVSHSTRGTTTDSTGHFRLADLPSGATRLYASHVGYQPQTRDLVLSPDTTVRDTIRLAPAVVTEDSVTVTAEQDEDWQQRFARFRRLFIGSAAWADSCSIQNPEVLRFDTSWWGKLEAYAARPLVIENQALGYRVTYHLEEFSSQGSTVRWDGEPSFDRLAPRDSAEARRWTRNRRRAFRGSLRHFLLSLLHDRLGAEKFRIYHRPRSEVGRRLGRPQRMIISREEVLDLKANPPHELNFSGRLEIVYDGEAETDAYLEWADLRRAPRDYQTSQVELNEWPVHVDRHGEIVEPYGATLYRYFAFSLRLSSLLPKGYRPPADSSLTPVPSPSP